MRGKQGGGFRGIEEYWCLMHSSSRGLAYSDMLPAEATGTITGTHPALFRA